MACLTTNTTYSEWHHSVNPHRINVIRTKHIQGIHILLDIWWSSQLHPFIPDFMNVVGDQMDSISQLDSKHSITEYWIISLFSSSVKFDRVNFESFTIWTVRCNFSMLIRANMLRYRFWDCFGCLLPGKSLVSLFRFIICTLVAKWFICIVYKL